MYTSSRADRPKRPERLRDSCNSCAQAKVRCTRDKPVCARCATKSLRCDYSPSMRKGKQRTTGGSISSTKKSSSVGSPRKSPPQTHEDLKRSYSTGSSHSRTTSHHSFPRIDQNVRTPSPAMPWNDGVWSSSGGMDDGFLGLFSQDVFAMQYMAQPLPDMFPSCGPLPNAFGGDQMSLDCAGVRAFADLSGFAGGGGAAMGPMDDMDVAMLGNNGASGLKQLQQQEQPHSYQPAPLSHGSPSAMSSCSTSTGTSRSNDSTQHDCLPRVLEMMAQVNSSAVEGGPAVPSRIRTLVRNKTIVDSIAQILQCSVCMQEMRIPHILTILTISLVASYQTVLQSFAGDHQRASNKSNSNSSSTSSSTSTTPPPPTASSQPPTVPITNTIAPALVALSGLGINAATSTHRNPTATPGTLQLNHRADFGRLPPSVARPAPWSSSSSSFPSMMPLLDDAKTRMQIVFIELARVRTLVDAMADTLRECGRYFDERAAAAASNSDGCSSDGCSSDGCSSGVASIGVARIDGVSSGAGGEAENLTHSVVLGQLEKVLRAKERGAFHTVVRAVR